MTNLVNLYIKDGLTPLEIDRVYNFVFKNEPDNFAKFAKLSFLYISWTFFKPFTFSSFLQKGSTFNLSGRQLIDLFSSSIIYIVKGQENKLEPELVANVLEYSFNLSEDLKVLSEKDLSEFRTKFLNKLDALSKASELNINTKDLMDLLSAQVVSTKEIFKADRLSIKEKSSESLSIAETSIRLYDKKEVSRLVNKLGSEAGDDFNKLQKKLLDDMLRGSDMKPLSLIPKELDVDTLLKDFPHFEELIFFIKRHVALNRLGGENCPLIIPPVLIVGPPGCGKSFFAQKVSQLFRTSYFERDLSVVSEAFILSGLDSGWKNSKPGLVFSSLMEGPFANPLICLNEVDKAKINTATSSPLNSLYTLLEPSSARKFQDEFIPLPLDASKIFWILTANELDLPEAIVSRLEVFEVAAPSEEHTKLIAQAIWKDLLKNAIPKGHPFSETLPEDVLTSLSKKAPRDIRKILLDAASLAALKNEKNLNSNLIQEIIQKRFNVLKDKKSAIGFISS